MGLSSAFGTDKVRNKNCVCPLVTVDLTENEDLLWKWLDDPFVVGVFLAPPCGSASRARQIPLGKKGKLTLRRHGPRPLRTGRHPNGIPFLNSSELSRISLSNKLYHLIAKVVRWAVRQVGCIFVVENPQYSLFWATSFWTEVANLCYYSPHLRVGFLFFFADSRLLLLRSAPPSLLTHSLNSLNSLTH